MRQLGRSRWSIGWDAGVLAAGVRANADTVELFLPMVRIRYQRHAMPSLGPKPLPRDEWTTLPAEGTWPAAPKPLTVWQITLTPRDEALAGWGTDGEPAPGQPRILFAWGPEPTLTIDGGWLAWVDPDGIRRRTDVTGLAEVSWAPAA